MRGGIVDHDGFDLGFQQGSERFKDAAQSSHRRTVGFRYFAGRWVVLRFHVFHSNIAVSIQRGREHRRRSYDAHSV